MIDLTVAAKRVQEVLQGYEDLRVVFFDSSTHTAELAAQTLHVEVGQIAKTLLFMADENPVVIVTCGDKKVHTRHFARQLGVKKVKFADTETVKALTGFEPGGVSPVGLKLEIPLYIDKSLYQYDIVYAAAGTDNSALPIAPERLKEITKASIVDVSQ